MSKKTHIRAIVVLNLVLVCTSCVAAYTALIMRNGGVTFKVHAPRAKSISIVGSFNRWQWDQCMLTGPDERGWWSVTLPLQQGRHEYLFLDDGMDWLTNPPRRP